MGNLQFSLGDRIDYPQAEDGSWPEDGPTEEEWFRAEEKARKAGLRLHDTGGGYVVVVQISDDE